MDWRNRKYYQVNPVYSYHDCIKRLKKINSVKISPPFRVSGGILFPKFTLGFNTDKETLVLEILQSSKYKDCNPIYKEITKEMIGQWFNELFQLWLLQREPYAQLLWVDARGMLPYKDKRTSLLLY